MLLWLRAAGLVGHAVALGSTVFALVVLHREPAQRPARALEHALALTGIGALVVVLAQAGLLAALAEALTVDDARWPVSALLSSTVGTAGLARITVGLVTVAAVIALCQAPASRVRRALLLGSSVLLAGTGTLASHAMGRMDGQASLLVVTALHQVAVGVWVGGLVCAAIIALRTDSVGNAWLRPFSTVALAAVAGIAFTGLGLSLAYVGTAGAAIGTSYGAMVLTKIVLFAALVAMGALNHRALHGRLTLAPWRAPHAADDGGSLLVRRRLEVEAALAVVTILLAASIGSAPPAADAGFQRATWSEIRAVVFTPKWPRLSSPTLTELAAAHHRAGGLRRVQRRSRGLADRDSRLLGASAEPGGGAAPHPAHPHRALRLRRVARAQRPPSGLPLELRVPAGGDLERYLAPGPRPRAERQQVGVLYGALASGDGAREPAGGLVALARAALAVGRAQPAGPDLGARACRVRAAARPLPRGVRADRYLRTPFSRQ